MHLQREEAQRSNWAANNDEDFSLKAGASTTLKFVEIPIGTTYQVDISCTGQNGGAAYSHNFSG